MRKTHALLHLVALLALPLGGCCTGGACCHDEQTYQTDQSTVKAQLMRLDDAWSAAAGRKDATTGAMFMAEDGVAYPPDMPVARGRAAVQKVWEGLFAMPGFVSISWAADSAGVAQSGELGYTVGRYTLTVQGPDGKQAQATGKYLCTWKKQPDGTWKAVHDMWNADAKM